MLSAFADELEKLAKVGSDQDLLRELRRQHEESDRRMRKSVRPKEIAKDTAIAAAMAAPLPFMMTAGAQLGGFKAQNAAIDKAVEKVHLAGYAQSLGYSAKDAKDIADQIMRVKGTTRPASVYVLKSMSPKSDLANPIMPDPADYQKAISKGKAFLGDDVPENLAKRLSKAHSTMLRRAALAGLGAAIPFMALSGLNTAHGRLQRRKELRKAGKL